MECDESLDEVEDEFNICHDEEDFFYDDGQSYIPLQFMH